MRTVEIYWNRLSEQWQVTLRLDGEDNRITSCTNLADVNNVIFYWCKQGK